MGGNRMWIFDYDMRAAERGFEMEKFHFSQEDWREYEKDYGYQEDTEPPTERVDDRRSYDWVDQLNQEMEETSLTDIDIDVILG